MSNIYHIQSIYPPSTQTRPDSMPQQQQQMVTVRSPVRTQSSRVLGQVEELQEKLEVGLVAEGEDLFTLEGVPQVYGHYSEEEREESEPDEGIHIPAKFREKKLTEVEDHFYYNHSYKSTRGNLLFSMFFVGFGGKFCLITCNVKVFEIQRRIILITHHQVAASLPVGIPWPAHLAGGPGGLLKESEPALTRVEDGSRPSDIAASIQAMARSVHTSSIFGDNVFGELPRPRVNTFSKD